MKAITNSIPNYFSCCTFLSKSWEAHGNAVELFGVQVLNILGK
jgi:hypothetical protein